MTPMEIHRAGYTDIQEDADLVFHRRAPAV